MQRKIWETIRPYVIIAPSTIVIACFVIYPTLYLVYLSFFKYNLLNRAQSKFIGIDNYVKIFHREEFYKSLANTAIYTVSHVVLTMLIALLVAVWLSKNKRINHLVQVGIFTPHIVSIVSIALVWLWLYDPLHGIFNYVLEAFGLPTSQWLQSSKTALASIIFMSVWQSLGYYTLIIVAAIKGISPDIFDAAALDGAGRFRMIYKIIIPQISPQLFFILVIMTIGSFKVFESVNIMTAGGPNYATNTIVYYIYQFRTTNIGYAAATGVVLMAIVGLLTVFYFSVLSRKVHYQ